jgi:hypothetical protein
MVHSEKKALYALAASVSFWFGLPGFVIASKNISLSF